MNTKSLLNVSVFIFIFVLLSCENLLAQSADPKDQANDDAVVAKAAKERPADDEKEEKGTSKSDGSRGKKVMVYVSVSGLYNSNVNHDVSNIDDVGGVFGGGIYFRNRAEDPNLELRYEAGIHNYVRTSKWDRLSHNFQLKSENKISQMIRAESEAEVSLKGSNEDRELVDRYSLTQFFQFRLTNQNRINLGGSLRLKRGYDDPFRNSVNPYLQAGYERRFGNGRQTLKVDYRYDWNRAKLKRYDYVRNTYSASFSTPFLSLGNLYTSVRYRPKNYSRIIDIELPNGEEIEVTRRDRTWLFGADWRRPIGSRLEMRLFYTYEHRNSNDLDKLFRSHAAGFSLTYRWWL